MCHFCGSVGHVLHNNCGYYEIGLVDKLKELPWGRAWVVELRQWGADGGGTEEAGTRGGLPAVRWVRVSSKEWGEKEVPCVRRAAHQEAGCD